MIILLTVGILLVLFSFLFRKKLPPYWGFILVLLIMGFQEGVEGDFMTYKAAYEMIESDHIADARVISSDDEPVMTYLMYLISYLFPYWLYVFIISFFQCFVLYKFVGKYTPKRFGYLAAILFYFTFNMMLLQMKAMRQGLAIEFMVLAFLIADGKRLNWLSPFLVVIAYFTHNSMLVVLPFYLLFVAVVVRQRIKWKKRALMMRDSMEIDGQFHHLSRPRSHAFVVALKRWWNKYNVFPIMMVLIYLLTYFFKITVLNQYLVPLMLMTGGSFNRLSNYAETTNLEESLQTNLFDISPLIVLYDAVIVFLVSSYIRNTGPKMRIFCIISIVAAFGDMLFYGAGAFARMIMYLVVFNLVVYPAVTLDIKKRYGKMWALAFMVFLIGYAVKTSLPWITGMTDDRFGTYRFVFMP